jgi:hypothetical protein
VIQKVLETETKIWLKCDIFGLIEDKSIVGKSIEIWKKPHQTPILESKHTSDDMMNPFDNGATPNAL